MLRTILFLCTLISLCFFTGCSRREPGASFRSEPQVYEATASILFELNPVTSFKTKGDMFIQEPSIFIADCRGDEEPEIVISEDNLINVYSLAGKLLLQEQLQNKKLVPAFTADFDKDGKEDIIFGSSGSMLNEISIVNGMGAIVSRFIAKKSTQDFLSITPQGVLDGRLYTTARPSDNEAPRGIICLDAFSLAPCWTFYCLDPLGLALADDLFVLSYRTDHSGVFRVYGNSYNPRRLDSELGVQGMMFKITTDGEAAGEVLVLDNGTQDIGSLEYTALSGNTEEILLINYLPAKEYQTPRYRLHKIYLSDGKIVFESNAVNGDFIGKIVFPYKDGFITGVLSVQNETHTLSFFDNELQPIKTFSEPLPLRLGPVITTPGNREFCLFFLSDGELFSLDQEFNVSRELPGTGCIQIKYFDYNGGRLLLYYEDRVEIYSIQ